jgi:hypothetical protein
MVIRGRTRGNGKQLGQYLLAEGENDNVQILDVAGRSAVNEKHLRDALLSMSLTAELTKSDKGLYHAQINPAYGEDRAMLPNQWLQAADLLGEELGLQEQRRIIVLHTKKGRTHAHVVWERYDQDKGRMISDSFSRLAQDRARKAMEVVFEHQKTPHRNVKRPEIKLSLSELWKQAKSGAEFVKLATQMGYTIAAGVQRRPFMVVDKTGRSFDLVRQLEGVKTKEVRERLGKEKLVSEKQAIESIRRGQANDNSRKDMLAHAFADNRDEMFKTSEQPKAPKEITASMFADNRDEMMKPETDQEKKTRQFKEQIAKLNQIAKNKGLGFER